MKQVRVCMMLMMLACLNASNWAQQNGTRKTNAAVPSQSEAAAASGLGGSGPLGTVTGSGTQSYIPLWTGSTTLGNSLLYQTGGHVGIGTTSPAFKLDVSGYINTTSGIQISGTPVLMLPLGVGDGNLAVGPFTLVNPTGVLNTAVGSSALYADTTGAGDTAIGASALQSNTTGVRNTAAGGGALITNQTGSYNTAAGYGALFYNTASDNTAVGYEALLYNTSGSDNTASGDLALENNTTGSNNTASGASAIFSNTSGSDNTALGELALENNITGNGNIAIGYAAASLVSGGNSNNIHIGSGGSPSDNGAIRIGTSGTQTSFFVAGVSGVTTGFNNAVPVMIDSNGQLGTVSSSRRFKEDIHDMGDASRGLMRLRPVTFRYQKAFNDGSKPIQYGLIAEEVEEIYPDLVAHSADGQIESVKYQVLGAMLLNEVQRQQSEIHELEERLAKMEAVFDSMSHVADERLAAAGVGGRLPGTDRH